MKLPLVTRKKYELQKLLAKEHRVWWEASRSREERITAMFEELVSVLEFTVDQYGKRGGPWNVPGTKGAWISMAEDVLNRAKEVKKDYE